MPTCHGLGRREPQIDLGGDAGQARAKLPCRLSWVLAGKVASAMHQRITNATLDRRSLIAKRVLIGVGLLFIVSGLIVGGLRLGHVIPKGYGWIGPLFLTLGTVGALTALLGLRGGRRWPLLVLAVLYVPWTIVGLIGDTQQGFWPLVIGEAFGLMLVVWALTTLMRRAV